MPKPHHFLLFLFLFLALLATPTLAAPLPFTPATVGAPLSNAPAELFTPAGAGPFPAMVVLHGCDGVGPHYRGWARQLRAWGYVALVVDSFRPRGVANVCNAGRTVPPETQAQDGFAAAAYLRALPTVRADRIGVIGFSHGGWAVLKAVLASTVAADHATPFAAAVAFYPGCDPPDSPLATDTLILIGSADDWTPAARCQRWRDQVATAGHTLDLTVFPNALHSFDAPAKPHTYAGHHLGRDPQAAAAAVAQTQNFLAQRLSP